MGRFLRETLPEYLARAELASSEDTLGPINVDGLHDCVTAVTRAGLKVCGGLTNLAFALSLEQATAASVRLAWSVRSEEHPAFLRPFVPKNKKSRDSLPSLEDLPDVPTTDRDLAALILRNSTPETAAQDQLIADALIEGCPEIEDETDDPGLPARIRRHRPRTLMRKFHETLSSLRLPSEEWCVASGLDLLRARTRLGRVRESLLMLSRGVRALPRAPVKNGDGSKSFERFAFLHGSVEIEVVPELYAKLALYAAFRERDHALLMTLKGHAITWLKENDVSFRDGYQLAVWSSVLAWVPGKVDEQVIAFTGHSHVQERLRMPAQWLGEGVYQHTANMHSWWNPLYQVARCVGLAERVRIPVA